MTDIRQLFASSRKRRKVSLDDEARSTFLPSLPCHSSHTQDSAADDDLPSDEEIQGEQVDLCFVRQPLLPPFNQVSACTLQHEF